MHWLNRSVIPWLKTHPDMAAVALMLLGVTIAVIGTVTK